MPFTEQGFDKGLYMVTGNEYIFPDIKAAIQFLLQQEKDSLKKDKYRQEAPLVLRTIPGLFNQPFNEGDFCIPIDSLEYPLSAWFNNPGDDKFLMTRLQSGRYSLKPNLRHRKYLFRGESEFHNPCKSNLSRNPGQKRFTRELMMGQEMMLLMMSHPLVQLLDLGVDLCGTIYRFEMNLFGLTQHYYNKTTFLDLTSDLRVAAFFATTKHVNEKDSYLPIDEDDNAIGVLYYYDLDINSDFGVRADGSKSTLSTIGLQVFPRSGQQKGFLYDLAVNQSFNDIPQVHAVRFYQQKDLSEKIWSYFHGGKDLFPDDILARHWRENYKDRSIVSKRTILMNKMFNKNMTLKQVEDEAKSLGLEIRDYVPRFSDEELVQYYNAVLNDDYWQNFCRQIHIPGDKDGKMMATLFALPEDPRYRWAFEPDKHHITDFDKGYVLREFKECLM